MELLNNFMQASPNNSNESDLSASEQILGINAETGAMV